jgi:O-antigen/teichoic acid export membrane protein
VAIGGEAVPSIEHQPAETFEGLRRLFRRRAGRALLYGLTPALSGLNALVGLMLPALLGPVAFGQYALAVTLFQYGLIFDFGVAQLIDRRVPVLLAAGRRHDLAAFVNAMLWLRLYIAGMSMLAGGLALAGLATWDRLPFGLASGVLSLGAGLAFMVALGPVGVHRASSDREGFAVSNGALMAILAVARPVGVVLDGVAGCFAALAACYAAAAGVMQWHMPPRAADRLRLAAVPAILAQSAPLFVTSLIWAFYMTANRWVVSLDAPQMELGYFAFGSNVVYLIVGSIGVLAPFYYPAMTSALAIGVDFCVSRRLLRDMTGLVALIGAATLAGILVGPYFVELLYPKFAGSAAVMRLLLVAVPALGLATWLMPLALSVARRPWVQGLLVYLLALAVLMAVTHAGYARGGITGAAFGLSASAIPLVGLQLAALRAGHVVTGRHAALLFATVSACTALLAVAVI